MIDFNWGCPACNEVIPQFNLAATIWVAVAVVAMLASLFIRAPYGRHARGGWGPLIPDRVGWIIFEGLALVFFNYFFFRASGDRLPVQYIFAGLYNLHYLNRAIIFPLRARKKGKRIPISIVGMAGFFNLANGYFLGTILGSTYPVLQASWGFSALFWVGLVLFVAGFAMNLWGDERLMRLRNPGETGYKIPRGGLFEWISCPNHLGEMIEWVGFALLSWPSTGLIFAIWTICNVMPRSLAHHQWYISTFEDYPAKRRALVPYIL